MLMRYCRCYRIFERMISCRKKLGESKKEKWFLNKAFDKREDGIVKPEPSVWITAKQMESHMDHMVRMGYKYYINE